ncbi:MAG: DUF1553 domain-containing protein, partial [Planctomycetota bacterium]
VPLNRHGKETYRRAIYHQNARASVVDLMAEFDQPDCAFSTPRRANTTTPLQALTLLNHSFTLDMATQLAQRLDQHSDKIADQVRFAFRLCCNRDSTPEEETECTQFMREHGLQAFSRMMLNTSEMIYVP